MTYEVSAIYQPSSAYLPIDMGAYMAKNLDEAMSVLMDDIREFMRNEESTNWWDDVLITVVHDHVKTSYPFDYWAKKFGWSF